MGREVGKWSNKEETSPEKGQYIKWTLDLWKIWHCRPWRKDNLFNKHYWGNNISIREKNETRPLYLTRVQNPFQVGKTVKPLEKGLANFL